MKYVTQSLHKKKRLARIRRRRLVEERRVVRTVPALEILQQAVEGIRPPFDIEYSLDWSLITATMQVAVGIKLNNARIRKDHHMGYARAAELMDRLGEAGVIPPPRKTYVRDEYFRAEPYIPPTPTGTDIELRHNNKDT